MSGNAKQRRKLRRTWRRTALADVRFMREHIVEIWQKACDLAVIATSIPPRKWFELDAATGEATDKVILDVDAEIDRALAKQRAPAGGPVDPEHR